MAGFGIPSAWGRPTPSARPAARPPATSMIWGRPATRTNGLGGFTLATPKAGQGGLSGPQTAQTAPSQTVPSPSPGGGGSGSGAAPGSSSASPLDSTYYGNIAANDLRVNSRINDLNAAAANDNTALKSVLDQLAYQQPRDALKLEQGANRTGGLYSSVYDQNLGNLQHGYVTRENTAITTNAEKLAAINRSIAELRAGVPIYDSQQYDASVGRSSKSAAADPATGQPPAGQSGSTPSIPPAPGPNSGWGRTTPISPAQLKAGKNVNWGLWSRPSRAFGRPPAQPNFGLRSRPGGNF